MGWTLDFTGSQMVVTLKLISTAFNVHDANTLKLVPTYDGTEKSEERERKLLLIKNIESLAKERERYALRTVPPLLSFLGYIYNPVTVLAGPVCEYKEYQDAADGSMFADCPNKQHPTGYAPILVTFVKAMIMMGLVACSGMYPLARLRSHEYLYEWSMIQQWLFVFISMFLIRCKYYFGWMLAESACIASGLGFNGYDGQGKERWDRMKNVFPVDVEWPENPRSVSGGWNSRVALWLRRYVYSRVGKPAQQTANSTLAAFVTSAFWHGFYPGYYFAFVFGTLFVETAKMLRRDLGPIFGKGGKFALLYPLYSLIATLLTLWVFNFMCVSFQLLDLMDAWRAMWALRFIPVFSAIAVVILLNITRPMLRKLHPLIKQA